MSIRKVAPLLVGIGGLIFGATEATPSAETAARLKQVIQQARAGPAAVQPITSEALRKRAQLLARGESALLKMNVEAAITAFDEAAGILHAADTEMGLVRAYMQGGEYRRAIAFVAHTAQAHREVPGAAALYAWLLYVGGHGPDAKRILSAAEKLFPTDAALIMTQRQLNSGAPIATGPLLKTPARLAPFGPAPGLPAASRVVGSGVLVDGGKRALVPLSTVNKANTVWLRDGLGRFSRGTVASRDGGPLAVVHLSNPIATGLGSTFATGDPFPGSPAFTVEYVATSDATPRWPLLTAGFIGRATSDGQRYLGIELPAGQRGGPVFNVAGQLTGIAVSSGDGVDVLLPISGLRDFIGPVITAPVGQRMPVDQIYELALRITVQVIAAR